MNGSHEGREGERTILENKRVLWLSSLRKYEDLMGRGRWSLYMTLIYFWKESTTYGKAMILFLKYIYKYVTKILMYVIHRHIKTIKAIIPFLLWNNHYYTQWFSFFEFDVLVDIVVISRIWSLFFTVVTWFGLSQMYWSTRS